MDAPTYVIVDGWTDKGKSKCLPLKWGHKNCPIDIPSISIHTIVERWSNG